MSRIVQRECRYCMRFSAMTHGRCPHCQRKQSEGLASRLLIHIAMWVSVFALVRLILF